MKHRKIKSTAVLIGLSPEGKCVYSEIIPVDEYWDGEHVWDTAKGIKRVRLATLKGFLFGSDGTLLQEFESRFNLSTGEYAGGWNRHADGTMNED
jgi:hypothetical protein